MYIPALTPASGYVPRGHGVHSRYLRADRKRPMMQKQVSDTQPSDEFNVDELVRKIDAKIAELEEEERRNKKEEEEKKKNANVEIIGDKDSEMLHQNSVIDKNLELDDDDDDDEFFDDFFDN